MLLVLQHYLRIQRIPQSIAYNAVNVPEVVGPYERNESLTAPFVVLANRYMSLLGIGQLDALPVNIPEKPPWHLDARFCRDLCRYKKARTNPDGLKMIFLEHLMEQHSDSVHIYTDGSKTENSAGCAAFSHQGTIKYKLSRNATIFTAELYAISAALSIIKNNNNRKFTILSDSKSALHFIEKPTIDHPLTSAIQT